MTFRSNLLLAALLLTGCAVPNVDKYPYGPYITMPKQAAICSAKSNDTLVVWTCK